MTIAARAIATKATATRDDAVTSWRKIAIAAGVLFLITDSISVVAVALYGPIHAAGYILGSGPDTQVILGTLFDIFVALAIVGTAVALFPVVRRQNEGVAIGYVGLRILEAGVIAVGVIPLLTVVTLRQHLAGTAGTDPATLATIGTALVGFYDWTFLVGPGLVCPFNTVLLAFLMYRTRLVPRFIPVLGFIGAPLVLTYNITKMFGILGDQMPTWLAIVVVPIFAWEVILAIWMIAKGFNRSAYAVASPSADTRELRAA